MIDSVTVAFIFGFIVVVAASFIVSIVAGWIADWREARRIKRIFAESDAAARDCLMCGTGVMRNGKRIPPGEFFESTPK